MIRNAWMGQKIFSHHFSKKKDRVDKIIQPILTTRHTLFSWIFNKFFQTSLPSQTLILFWAQVALQNATVHCPFPPLQLRLDKMYPHALVYEALQLQGLGCRLEAGGSFCSADDKLQRGINPACSWLRLITKIIESSCFRTSVIV